VNLRILDGVGGVVNQTVSIAVLGRQPSCFHYRAQNASVGDGIYPLLQPQDAALGCASVGGCAYQAFCDMQDGDVGDDGGWTLILKIDGDDDGFDYDDPAWEDTSTGAPGTGDDNRLNRPTTAGLVVDNDTKLRSGAEVTVLLPRSIADLPGALALISDELAAFGADPRWAPKLLEPPRLLGIEAGQQGEARRALLGRLVERLQGWPRRAGELQGTNV
jgi:hypothetical protein